MSKKQDICVKISKIKKHTDDVFTIFVPWDLDNCPVKEGQFFQLKASKYLRTPISVSHIDGEIGLTIRNVGTATNYLSTLLEGDTLTLFGPLGNGFEIKPEKKGLLIGGGIGIAPLVPISKKYGFPALLGYLEIPYLHDEFDQCTIYTQNKTEYNHGLVIDGIDSHDDAEIIYACGPTPMLEAVARIANEKGIEAQLLFEEQMACGVGACLVCTCETTNFKRVCKDGPMFYAKDLNLSAQYSNNKASKKRHLLPQSLENSDLDCLYIGLDELLKQVDLSVDLGGLKLKNPVTTASGTYGFAGEYSDFYDVNLLGAVSVKGLTLEPRNGNTGIRLVQTPSGMINSVGLQNAGIKHFIDSELPRLKKLDTKVIININGNTTNEYEQIAEITSGADVDSIELNISCPNVKEGGLAFGTNVCVVEDIVKRVRASVKDTHLIVKLTPNVTNIVDIAKAAKSGGADALSLINTVSGMGIDVKTGRKILDRGFGGLSGPAIKPIALKMVNDIYTHVDIPILGMGGISNHIDALEFIMAGATAIALGTSMFTDPYAPIRTLKGLALFMKENGYHNLAEIRGIANKTI